MTTLIFLLTVAAVAGAILAAETRADGGRSNRAVVGLIDWLSSGNWPAKIGAGLLIVGVGALIRFALQNLEFPPAVKFGSGIAVSALLGLASTFVGRGPQRRAVALALGGAAFGVAYLTAYSAFALFGYVDNETGTGLLLLTAIGASVYAVTRSALSLAVLAMFGAFLAPAFAVTDPGPTIVYGYYVVASLVTLVMVAARGWRPLIHLSFVFTLAGGTVFAWTSKYYTSAFADVMQPALLLLAAIHVAMPIAERRGESRVWVQRLDVAYTLALPVVAALAAAFLADSADRLTWTLGGLGIIWLLAAGILRVVRSEGAAGHLVIGVLLLGLAGAARFRELPWELLGLAFTVIALWMASRWSASKRLQTILAGLVPVTAAIHVITALTPAASATAFANERFAERAIGAALIMFAGHVCRRTRSSLDTLLWSVGVAWAVVAVGFELMRADLVTIALVVHWLAIGATVVLALASKQRRAFASFIVFLPLAVVFSASWANDIAPLSIAWVSLFVAPLALVWLGTATDKSEDDLGTAAIASIVLAPLVAGIWAEQALGTLVGERLYTAASVGAAAALLLLVFGRAARVRGSWNDTVEDVFAFAFAALLIASTTIDISREPSAIVFELLCVSGLVALVAMNRARSAPPDWLVPATAIGTILWLQAVLLRLLGPPGDLTLRAIDAVSVPAAISLLWAVSGAVLTFWGHRKKSRPLWVGGATLLVGATVKIVLFDIGSLGELSNILAVIAAGLVFLAVGWVAPLPPAPPAQRRSAPADDSPPPAAAAPTNEHRSTSAASHEQPSSAPDSAAREQTHATRTATAARAEPTAPAHAKGDDYWQHTAGRAKGTASGTAKRAPAVVRAAAASGRSSRVWMIVLVVFLLLPALRFGEAVLGMLFVATVRVMEPRSAPVPPPPRARTPAPVLGAAATPQIRVPGDAPVTVPQAVPQAVRQAPSAVPAETECQRWSAQIPADYELVAGGGYRGKPLGFAIQDEDQEAGSFDVIVNYPGRDVVVLLGAYDPSIWTIRWTTGTRIAGVWVSGYHRHRVTGLLPETPLLLTHNAGSYPTCPNFYISQDDTHGLSDASERILGRVPERAVIADGDGHISFGSAVARTAIERAPAQPPSTFRDMNTPLSGDAGLDELVRRGRLKVATDRDVKQWTEFARGRGQLAQAQYATFGERNLSGNPWRTFVVLAPMTFPSGLNGAHRVTFIVARGVQRPTGNPGHSTILTYE